MKKPERCRSLEEIRVARVIASKRKLAEELGVSPDLIGSLYGMMIEYFIGEEREVFQHG